MTIAVRALTDSGITAFRAWIDSLAEGATGPPPAHLLQDSDASQPLAADAQVDPAMRFKDKVEFGKYLTQVLDPVRSSGSVDRDVGLWSWLALCFFDQVCPPGEGGKRKLGQNHRYILARDYKHHYRHLVRTPCLAYALHGETARVVLGGALHVHGEASEALLSREHLFTNTALFAAMDRLYLRRRDGECQVKAGSRGKGGGSMRRLGKIVRQFDLTYDLRAMDVDQILGLLPVEFDRFRPAGA